MELKRNVKILMVSGGVLILLIAGGALGFAFSRSSIFDEGEDIRELELVVDKEKIMKDEQFNISIKNIPDDTNITWFLGDGEIKFGPVCCYSYEISMTHEIVAEAKWDGGYGNGTVEICCQLEDYHTENEGNTIRDLRRGWGSGSWIDAPLYYCEFGDGPTIDASVTLYDAVGRIEIWVYIWASEYNFYKEYTYMATYETISFEEVFSNLEIPQTSEQMWFEVDFIVWDGRIGSYSMSLDVDYPGNDDI